MTAKSRIRLNVVFAIVSLIFVIQNFRSYRESGSGFDLFLLIVWCICCITNANDAFTNRKLLISKE